MINSFCAPRHESVADCRDRRAFSGIGDAPDGTRRGLQCAARCGCGGGANDGRTGAGRNRGGDG
ncbi:hypothetical protein BLTE_23780 [Blastochloris tepida]|uniref:Uncharacterized protein n=1 Tax=Blastochloris tepida TaxID=2233851 RepID=A0A348G2B0_9HYPH|nr:hypothetical protein BLTE_23780 [Blastochloris tepida]